ncbi:MAG: ABC transporter ATP-binding protein [Thermodesulfobacteriota bacterium]|jgi:lipopolysaccharide transport system ATP-binding protein
MSDIALRVEKLSKLYRIGSRENGYKTLRESIVNAASSPFRRLSSVFGLRSSVGRSVSSVAGPRSPVVSNETIWGLKDVSFGVKRGEIVGIIGRNGAGKSTLLKILSRITEPTEGYAEIYGRVGSLLEVGTGFHPELTGRENIFLNGAILGMRKAEIEQKFDEIVSFAEIEKFIDTPVKHYSSGMYVRLAFAVAAHLEPEILLVDEVLAVGDASFQKKSLGKMGDVAKGGRTILFVSHQLNQLRRLCGRAIWLDEGKVQGVGPAGEVISEYEAKFTLGLLESANDRKNDHVAARFLRWEVVEPRTEQPNVLGTGGPVTLRFSLKVNQPIKHARHGIALLGRNNQLLWGTDIDNISFEPGIYELIYRLPTLPIQPGMYFWKVSLFNDDGLIDIWDCTPGLLISTLPVTHSKDEWAGILNIPYEFSSSNRV